MKIFKRVMIVILLACVLVCGIIVLNGYKMYKDAISEISIEDKVNEIRNQENYVKIEDISKQYQDAVIAVEDHRFREHNGIDIIALGRAVFNNIKEFSLVEGGSTITQQLAKNMYFSQKKEFTRKVAEVFVAFELEKNYTKDEILELYLNTIYFGDGYYGIKSASLGYFDKEPKDLTLYESTILAGIPNAPSVYSLTENPDLAKKRQEKVLNSMVENNMITSEEANEVLEQQNDE